MELSVSFTVEGPPLVAVEHFIHPGKALCERREGVVGRIRVECDLF
ncbi:MAG: hypothetical protein U5K70_00980 [Halodesulfurarchaeum sp.]|nr:hypothetical protein [Halodesulfurarchaeum sp.]